MTDHDEMAAHGRYRVDLERDETGAWIAGFPDVPGAHTYGRTLRQARGRIREALALWASDAATAELDERIGVVDDTRTALQVALAAREDAERTEQDAISWTGKIIGPRGGAQHRERSIVASTTPCAADRGRAVCRSGRSARPAGGTGRGPLRRPGR